GLRLPSSALRRRSRAGGADGAERGGGRDRRSQRHPTKPCLARHASVRVAHLAPNSRWGLCTQRLADARAALAGQSCVTAATLGALRPVSTQETALGGTSWRPSYMFDQA